MLFITKARDICKLVAPAIVHVDGTARVQTVTTNANPDPYATIQAFYKIKGFPIIINMSFNLNREAILNNFQDAIESFIHIDIDFLAIKNYIVAKRDIRSDENNENFLERRLYSCFGGEGANFD